MVTRGRFSNGLMLTTFRTGLPAAGSLTISTESFVGDDFLKCRSFLVIVSAGSERQPIQM
jgi:hypothetical protein